MWDECVRCREAPAVDEFGFCGHCFWVFRAEVEDGLYAMRQYLRAWADFQAWEASREQA